MSDNKTIKISSQIMNTVDELILAKGSEVAVNIISNGFRQMEGMK